MIEWYLVIMVILRREGREDRRRGERRAPKLSRRGLIIGSMVVVAIGAVSAMLILFTGSDGKIGPNVGDHFHGKYAVRVCGDKITDFPYSSGGIHTHGDGLIHIHPTHVREAGSNATIARFMAGTGSQITDNFLTLPTGEKYENGQLCPDGKIGELLLKVNGVSQNQIAEYVLSESEAEQEIEILFQQLDNQSKE